MFRIYDGRAEFYQWDLNRKLIVKDASITEVHFCNKLGDCALVCEVYTEGAFRVVDVPNILLQTVWRIRAYGYTDNHTEYETYFDVKPRTKPADYIYTETEVKRYENFEERLAALEGKEVDLTGYATEEFVNSAIAENAPNWNADGITLGEVNGVIANRTHYSKQIFKCGFYEDATPGILKLVNLSQSGYSTYAKYLKMEQQKLKYNRYPVTIYFRYRNKWGEQGFNYNYTNAKALDTTNLYITPTAGFTIYIILDRTILTDEQKGKFDTNGIYFETTADKETSVNWFTHLEIELRTISKKLPYMFMPAEFLEIAEAETLYYKKTDVDELLAALEARITALEG